MIIYSGELYLRWYTSIVVEGFLNWPTVLQSWAPDIQLRCFYSATCLFLYLNSPRSHTLDTCSQSCSRAEQTVLYRCHSWDNRQPEPHYFQTESLIAAQFTHSRLSCTSKNGSIKCHYFFPLLANQLYIKQFQFCSLTACISTPI